MKTSRGGWISRMMVAVVVALLAWGGAGTAWGAVTNVWNGDGADALASNPANWVGNVAPVDGAHILLDATSSKNMTWNTNLTLNSWTQVGYTGTVTVNTVYSGAFTNLTITGDCVISNGVWAHVNNTTVQTNRLHVTVGGNLTVGTNGAVNVTALGLQTTAGQSGGPTMVGGSHGGMSSKSTTSGSGTPGPTYGSIVAPVDLGKGGARYYIASVTDGGGAIKFSVTGTTTLDGLFAADGTNSLGHKAGGGAGGSVWLTTGSLTGAGTIRAVGGAGSSDGGHGPGGGGGRIAVVLTNGTSFGSVTMQAYGGAYPSFNGAAGTIYRERAGDTPGQGELIVNNAGRLTYDHAATDLNGVASVAYTFSRLTLTNAGVIRIGSDDVLTLTGATIEANPTDRNEGIRLSGGTLLVDGAFVQGPYFVAIDQTNSTFSPATSYTLGDLAEFVVNRPHSMTCGVTVADGGWLRHDKNTTNEVNKLDLTILGNLTVEDEGRVDVTALGYQSLSGPGAPSIGYAGGSHGGMSPKSTYASSGNPGPTYGSIMAPVNIGSGGGRFWSYDWSDGGGAIKLTVTGTTTLDGLFAADGTNNLGHQVGGGAGGSVWLTTGSLTGSGTIRAVGGAGRLEGSSPDPAGGGGRLAVVLTNGTTFGSVTMQAYGGYYDGSFNGGAGTIYLRTKDQGPANGTLIVDNTNRTGNTATAISSQVTGTTVGDVIIRNEANLQVNTNQSLTVMGSWSNSASFTAQTSSTVTFGGTNTSRIYGNSTFDTLICTNAGTRLEFAAGSSNSVTTALTLTGDATSNIFLRSTSDGSQWKINVAAAVNPTLSYLDVRDSDASPGKKLVALNSVGEGQNNLNWDFVTPGQTNTWTGGLSTDWATSGNWDKDRPPIAEDARIVIASGTYDPLLSSAQTFNNLEIQNGASLRLNGYGLTVNQSATIAGALIASNTETLVFKGDTDFSGGGSFTPASSTVIIGGTNAQAITPAGNTFYTVRVTNTAGVVTFADAFTTTYLRSESASVTYGGNLTAMDVRLYSTAGTVTQTFNAASTYAIGDWVVPVSGANGISLRSSNNGTAWLLNVTRSAFVRNATVQDSDARGGIPIHAMNSTGVSGNHNWDFGGTWGLWTGGTSASFTNASNWASALAPDATTRVVIDGGYANAPVIATNQAIRQLVLGLEQASALTANAPLTIGEGVTVGRFGTLELNKPVTVGGDFSVLDGGWLRHDTNTTAEVNKLDLTILGNLTVVDGGRVDVTARGLQTTAGQNGGPVMVGGSHGGMSSKSTTEGSGTPGPTYGSIAAPVDLGSGGGRYWATSVTDGGGAITLSVTGTTTLDGLFAADGTNSLGHKAGGGAGGSVWLTTGSLTGSGTIRAVGGAGRFESGIGANPAGGGGRIAIVLTNGTTFGSVTMQAYGGYYDGNFSGAAGTIYRQTKDQANGAGTVTIHNNALTTDARTHIPPMTNAVLDELRYASVIVTNRGAMAVTTNATVAGLTVASTNEPLNLGESVTVLDVGQLIVHGTPYTKAGLYTAGDWNGYSPTPGGITGEGAIRMTARGTLILLR